MKHPKKAKAGLQVFPVASPTGQSLLDHYRLAITDIDEAIQRFVSTENQVVGTFVGVCPDGLIAAEKRNWNSKSPDAFSKPMIFIPWMQVLELLERVPDGTTGKLFNHRGTRH